MPPRTQYLTAKRKRQIFAELVHLQDAHQVTVAESKRVIAEQFRATAQQVEACIQEGLSDNWLEDLDSMDVLGTVPQDDDGA